MVRSKVSRTVSAETVSILCAEVTGLELIPNGAASREANMQRKSVIVFIVCAKIIKKRIPVCQEIMIYSHFKVMYRLTVYIWTENVLR